MGRGTGTGGWLGGCRQSRRKAAVPAVRVLCITTVIPAKAGASADGTTIQRGGARAVHAESHRRDIAPNGYAKNPVRVLCITTVIPAKAGIQRGGARAVHAESHHRDIAPNGCAKNPVRVICTTSQTTDSRLDHVRHPLPTPLDSGFRRNDGRLQRSRMRISGSLRPRNISAADERRVVRCV